MAWADALFPGLRIVWMAGPGECWWMVLHPLGVWTLVGIPRDQCWAPSLLIAWTGPSSVLSKSSQAAPNCVGVLICQRLGSFCGGIWTGWIHEPNSAVGASTRSFPWVTAAPYSTEGWGKWPSVKEPGDAGWQWLNVRQHVPKWPGSQMISWSVLKIQIVVTNVAKIKMKSRGHKFKEGKKEKG